MVASFLICWSRPLNTSIRLESAKHCLCIFTVYFYTGSIYTLNEIVERLGRTPSFARHLQYPVQHLGTVSTSFKVNFVRTRTLTCIDQYG